MMDESVAESSRSRAALRWMRSRFALALRPLSLMRVGPAFALALVAYFVFVVPEEFAGLVAVSMAGAAAIGLVPLAVVYAVIRSPI